MGPGTAWSSPTFGRGQSPRQQLGWSSDWLLGRLPMPALLYQATQELVPTQARHRAVTTPTSPKAPPGKHWRRLGVEVVHCLGEGGRSFLLEHEYLLSCPGTHVPTRPQIPISSEIAPADLEIPAGDSKGERQTAGRWLGRLGLKGDGAVGS